jgi:hypothetical protein
VIHSAADLDLADLGEVRRRVLEPVLAAMLRPGELDGADIVVGTDQRVQRANWIRTHFGVENKHRQVFAVVWAGGESFAYGLGYLDAAVYATTIAIDWAESLSDWIDETPFGWGERPRELPAGFRAADPS